MGCYVAQVRHLQQAAGDHRCVAHARYRPTQGDTLPTGARVSATKKNANCDTDPPVLVPAKTIMTSVGIGMGRPSSSIMTARRIAPKLCLNSELSTTTR
jgi:hypothetical protein